MMRLGLLFALLATAAAENLAAQAAPASKGPVPNSVCADCHEVEAKLTKSAHAKVGCATCHLKHEEYPHPEKQPKPQCVTCHEGVVREYEMSEHMQQIRKGNGSAPECSTCHGATHEVTKALTESFHKSVPETCGMCHDKALEQFSKSVHGKAIAAGIQGAPVCTDCHGGHRILRAKDPRSTVFSASVPDTCGRCHGDLRLMKRFGLPADRITSFESSFHGLALKSGNQSVADCSSCHGYHEILSSSDPKSKTNARNLAKTCGACHPGAGTRFTIGPIHEQQGSEAPLPIYYAQMFYMLLIPGTVGFMLLHHAGDFIQKLRHMRFRGHAVPIQMLRTVAPKHQRMYKVERIQHALLALSFMVLAFTGFALHYPDSWWASWFLRWESNVPVRGTIHRTAGVVMVLTAILHLVTLVVSRHLRDHWKEMLPASRDLREMVEGTLWRLGLLSKKPEQSSHSYIEKIEYWALVWGTIVMAITGALLWFNNWSLTIMPKVWLDFSRVIHFYEAILATAAILVWHFYMVIFDPAVYPLDTAWLTGFSPRAEHERDQEHGHEPGHEHGAGH